MHKFIFRVIFSALLLFGIYFIYSKNYLAPLYIKNPEAKTYKVPASRVYLFPNLSGPDKKTTIPDFQSTKYQQFEDGSTSRLAILLTDENSYWLDLVHGLKSYGIPFLITNDYRKALKHKVVLVYPTTVGLPQRVLDALKKFPYKGGTLVAQGLISPALNHTFGIGHSSPVKKDFLSLLNLGSHSPITESLQYPEQKNIRTGDTIERTFANARFLNPEQKPVAEFENKEAAIVEKDYANGHAYAFGLDLGHFFAIGYSSRQWNKGTISNEYVNHYEPHIDVLLELLKNIYIQNQPAAVTLSPTPNGKSLSVIFTFDNDSAEAIANMGSYKELLVRHGIKGTFFILTKYITDGDDFAFFTEKNLPLIQALVDANMDVNSEGVSHSFDFDQFPLGTGKERYSTYQPYVMHTRERTKDTILGELAKTVTYNGSILGELRVSRFLLNHFYPTLPLNSFRPGFLKYPTKLPQALMATGMKYVSATTAGDSLTHLPFQLNFNRGSNPMIQAQLPVYEFPITLEDQKGLAINERINEALMLAKKISSLGGLYVVLIHPDGGRIKPGFLDEFISEVPKVAPVWFTTLSDFGDWWSARDKVGIDIKMNRKDAHITITIPKKISGLTLILPKGYVYHSSEPEPGDIIQKGRKLILPSLINGTYLISIKNQCNSPSCG